MILVPHVAFFIVKGNEFDGEVPFWLITSTSLLYFTYMVLRGLCCGHRIWTTWTGNRPGEQVFIIVVLSTDSCSPLGMVLDH
jgi:hypothetical protein